MLKLMYIFRSIFPFSSDQFTARYLETLRESNGKKKAFSIAIFRRFLFCRSKFNGIVGKVKEIEIKIFFECNQCRKIIGSFIDKANVHLFFFLLFRTLVAFGFIRRIKFWTCKSRKMHFLVLNKTN